ncbi:porin [Paraburkholderia guartelaensis]|uniref:porin n=1 Tax=Paraburkholderia guartelaensis TaxID=2546446 RepID=UPI002AB7DE2F|nr:porin [Paraburkholderia guartelaensis]
MTQVAVPGEPDIASPRRFAHIDAGFPALHRQAGLTATESAYRGRVHCDSGEVNVKYLVAPELRPGVAYSYTHGGDADSRGDAYYQQVTPGADYLLSKRTDIYAVTALQKVGGVNSTGQAAVAAINGTTASSTDSQIVTSIGLRHKF